MTEKNWVKCSITYYYDKNTYIYEEQLDDLPDDEEILNRCKLLMIEDVLDFHEPIDTRSVRAEFVEEPVWEVSDD